ncbi:hypothetical protein GCM10023310_29950 [Paenibacillus vulneris]
MRNGQLKPGCNVQIGTENQFIFGCATDCYLFAAKYLAIGAGVFTDSLRIAFIEKLMPDFRRNDFLKIL